MKYLRRRVKNNKNNKENKTGKTYKTISEVCHGCRYLSLMMPDNGVSYHIAMRPMVAVCNRPDSKAIVLANFLSEFYSVAFFTAFGEESCPFKKVKGDKDEISEK